MRSIVALGFALSMMAACSTGGGGAGGDDGGGDDGGGDDGGGDDGGGDDDVGDISPIDIDENNLFPSPAPPGNLKPSDAPMIIAFGWDDMAFTGDHAGDSGETDSGMNFLIRAFGDITNPDGSKGAVSFYQNGAYLPNSEQGGPWGSETNLMLQAGKDLVNKGFEVGNHTFDHLETNGTWGRIPSAFKNPGGVGWLESVGTKLDKASWSTPVISANDALLKSSYGASKIYGFRAPRLEINDAGLQALSTLGYEYDVSLEEGQQWEYVTAATKPGADDDGFHWVTWPHTLDNGSPGVWQSQDFGEKPYLVDFPRGLWEVPVYMLYVPDGLQTTIATRMKTEITMEDTSWIEDRIREITAFDFNTFLYARIRKAEWVEIMKYNFLLRYNGNRAPLTFGAHPEEFSRRYDSEVLSQANNADFLDVLGYNTYRDRKAAVLEFITWVKANYGDDVYFLSGKQLVDYMKNPFDKEGRPVAKDVVATPAIGNLFKRLPEWEVTKDDLGSDATVESTAGSITVDFTIGTKNEAMQKYPYVDVAAHFAAGAFENVSHIDLEYEAEAPFRLRLLTEDGLSMQALFSGGPGTRTARVRTKDFCPDPYAAADQIGSSRHVDKAYLAKVSGLSIESASTKDRTTFQVKIKRIIVHGLGPVNKARPRLELRDAPVVEKKLERPYGTRPASSRGSSVHWPAHRETDAH